MTKPHFGLAPSDGSENPRISAQSDTNPLWVHKESLYHKLIIIAQQGIRLNWSNAQYDLSLCQTQRQIIVFLMCRII